ncbi:hypothetical protein sos41_13650 [Alphaproteobacteria bacterium SO-S41]|nr:hypothetical protein sos41_13650 [Alphaproteobacteria bacterium SO-S41]
MSDPRQVVSAAEIIRNFGFWQQQALAKPLTITHHGRARVMLLSTEEYERLRGQNAPAGDAAPINDAEIKLATILENMAEGFILYDRDLRLMEMNRVAEAYFGVSREHMLGKTVAEALGRPGNTIADEILRRVLRTGEIETYEASSAIFPGRKIMARAFPYRDGVASLSVNVTEREHMRAAAAEWVAGQTALAQLNQIALVKLDSRGRMTSVDEHFERLTGFTGSDLAEVRMFDIVENADRRRLQTGFESVISNRVPAAVAVRILGKSGDVRSVTLAMAPLTQDFTALGVLVVVGEGKAVLETVR